MSLSLRTLALAIALVSFGATAAQAHHASNVVECKNPVECSSRAL